MDSEYSSVTEQAGIYAGNRGFDIYIEDNTDLKGAVIDSKATADKNNLDTGTLTFSDIDNKAEYDTKGYGFSYSGLTNEEKKQSDRPVMQGDKGLIPAIPMASGDETESSTKSAVADGTITIRNKEQQKQNVENLRRETKNTLNKLDKIFDKDKIEEKQELAGLFSELSFNAIHNLSKNWTEEQKVLAHSVVGYISGELANSKNSFSTALTAGINKFVIEEILKDKKTYEHYKEHPEELQWISAALGAAIGQMAGGDATSGASIASSATKNNYMNYVYIKKDENGKEEKLGGHYELNEDCAKEANLTDEQVEKMNKASDDFDKTRNQLNPGHAMPNDAYDIFTLEFTECVNQAIEYKNQGNEDAAMEYLGYANHILGDYRSHYLNDGTWPNHIYGWASGAVDTVIWDILNSNKVIYNSTSSPDNPFNNIGVFNDAKSKAQLLGQYFKNGQKITEKDIEKFFPKMVKK